jgi:hypothetical protein
VTPSSIDIRGSDACLFGNLGVDHCGCETWPGIMGWPWAVIVMTHFGLSCVTIAVTRSNRSESLSLAQSGDIQNLFPNPWSSHTGLTPVSSRNWSRISQGIASPLSKFAHVRQGSSSIDANPAGPSSAKNSNRIRRSRSAIAALLLINASE